MSLLVKACRCNSMQRRMSLADNLESYDNYLYPMIIERHDDKTCLLTFVNCVWARTDFSNKRLGEL